MSTFAVVRPTLFFTILSACLAATLQAKEFSFFHENVLGTSLELKVDAASKSAAEQAEGIALAEIDRLNKIYSTYSPDTELSKFSALENGQSLRVSKELAEALALSQQWMTDSHGAFNPGVELISKIWADAAKAGKLPTDAELSDAVEQVQQPPFRVASALRRATRTSDAPLNLNAIAKGIVLDRVAEKVLASSKDVKGLMINIGGDIRVAGEMSVPVAIADPKNDAINATPATTLTLTTGGIATSGDSERGWTIEGKHYSHIIDPQTGEPVTKVVSAAVTARDAATADVVATICNVLSPEEALEFVQTIPRTECRLETADGKVITSKGWGEDASDKAAPKNLQMDVEFEIARADNSGRYRRPYVAVWVEDEEGFPVKTLSLFMMTQQPGPRWHRDLRRWYSADQVRRRVQKTNLIATVSKPTRNPGVYRVTWDGTSDEGKPLPGGIYTLFVESAREHGGYVLMKHSFDLAESFKKELEPNSEIGSVKIENKVGTEAK